jgi:hypothetical protein
VIAMVRNFAWLIVVVVLSGCATMYNPGSQAMPVASAPTGATVFVDGEHMGTTPLTLTLNNRSPVTLTLRLSDGRERTVELERRFDNVAFTVSLVPAALVGGALVAGMLISSPTGASGLSTSSTPPEGLIGALAYALGLVAGAGVSVVSFGVDAATGSWYRLLPGEVMVVFDD